jgi:hypothetical protein
VVGVSNSILSRYGNTFQCDPYIKKKLNHLFWNGGRTIYDQEIHWLQQDYVVLLLKVLSLC